MENAVEIRDFAFFASFRDFWGVFWGHYGCEMDIPGYFNEKCSLRKIKYMDGIFWASGIEWYWFGQNRMGIGQVMDGYMRQVYGMEMDWKINTTRIFQTGKALRNII